MPWNPATLSILVVGVQGDSSCTLQRVDSHGLSFSRFKQLQRNGRPFVVHSFDIVPELASSRDELLEAFGNVKVQLESGIDEASAFFRLTKEWRSFRDYSQNPTGQQDLVFEHGFIGKLSRSMWRSKFQMMPEILQKDVAFPILTLGNNGTGTSMHQHEGTWLLLMTGLKAWWIADGTTRTRSFGQRDPCQNLGTSLNDLPEGFQFCVQKAGELVYFPDNSYHATCNMDTFVWGLGSQSSNADWQFFVKTASLGDISVIGKKLKKNSMRKTIRRAIYAAALQRALGFGHRAVADKLVEFAADFGGLEAGEPVGYCTSAPIHAVAESGNVTLAKQLLSAGVDPEEPHSKIGFIALEISAYLGHVGMVDLLAAQPGPLMQTQRSTLLANALRNAAQNGHLAVMRLLETLGADPLIPDGDQRVTFHMAAAGGQVSAVKLLRNMTQAVPGAHSARDRDGHTPLHAAAERGHVKVVRQLLRWRCSIETESQHQSRPLHLAARHGHGPVISFLLEKQANHAVKDETGAEPLHLAVISGCKSAVEILLQSGAQVHSRNHEGNQPIHIAADSGQASIAMLLLSARSDVNAIGAQGQPWMMAQAQQDVKLSVALKPHQEL